MFPLFQGDNGRFQLGVEKDGLDFPVFDVVPATVLNEATLLIRVKNSSALDYERVRVIEFQVQCRYLIPAPVDRTSASAGCTNIH